MPVCLLFVCFLDVQPLFGLVFLVFVLVCVFVFVFFVSFLLLLRLSLFVFDGDKRTVNMCLAQRIKAC